MLERLETERLYHREFTLDDASAMYRLNLDPEVIRYTGDPPFEFLETFAIVLMDAHIGV